MPVPNNRARLIDLGRGLNSNKNNHCCNCRNRRSRLHRNAERALVGVAIEGVGVRHLDHREQCEQDQTHKNGRLGNVLLPAALSTICLKSCQSTIPNHKVTCYWTRQPRQWLRFLVCDSAN